MSEKLAELIEQAEGPDRELDREIARTLPRGEGWRDCMGEPGYEALPFTASLDAAMTLVPEGWFVQSLTEYKQRTWNAVLRSPQTEGDPSRSYTSAQDVDRSKGVATPALALCAAALRARATHEGR